jgi:hypothetical protein
MRNGLLTTAPTKGSSSQRHRFEMCPALTLEVQLLCNAAGSPTIPTNRGKTESGQ